MHSKCENKSHMPIHGGLIGSANEHVIEHSEKIAFFRVITNEQLLQKRMFTVLQLINIIVRSYCFYNICFKICLHVTQR